MMDAAGLLAGLERQGEMMAGALSRVPADRTVPTCPEWAVRDLAHHTGRVHRWAAGVVGAEQDEPWSDLKQIVPDGWPADADLADWFREGLRGLASVLREAPDDLRCFTFLPVSDPKLFWTRRMAHETAIHRLDAELSAGGQGVDFEPGFAADGVDELLTMFVERTRGRLAEPLLTAPRPVTLRVAESDGRGRWMVRFGPVGASGRRDGKAAEADCTVTGPAASLYPFLWNRPRPRGIRVQGDREVLEFWRHHGSF